MKGLLQSQQETHILIKKMKLRSTFGRCCPVICDEGRGSKFTARPTNLCSTGLEAYRVTYQYFKGETYISARLLARKVSIWFIFLQCSIHTCEMLEISVIKHLSYHMHCCTYIVLYSSRYSNIRYFYIQLPWQCLLFCGFCSFTSNGPCFCMYIYLTTQHERRIWFNFYLFAVGCTHPLWNARCRSQASLVMLMQ